MIVADDLPKLVRRSGRGAGRRRVARRSTNAGKHGGARSVTVYAEPDDDGRVFCSVKDDGPASAPTPPRASASAGRSAAGSADVGGRVEVDGNPGRGTEVRLWV